MRQLDWKVVALALVACYLVPGIVLAGVVALVGHVASPDLRNLATALLSIVSFLAPPVAGGYVAARFAPRAPWMHVMVIGVLGAVLSLLAFRATPRAMVLYVLASVALAAFAGFVRLGARRKA